MIGRLKDGQYNLNFPDFPYLGIWTQKKPFDTTYVCY